MGDCGILLVDATLLYIFIHMFFSPYPQLLTSPYPFLVYASRHSLHIHRQIRILFFSVYLFLCSSINILCIIHIKQKCFSKHKCYHSFISLSFPFLFSPLIYFETSSGASSLLPTAPVWMCYGLLQGFHWWTVCLKFLLLCKMMLHFKNVHI